MKYIWLFLLFIFGCQSSTNRSFDSLSEAFINWYYKFHPVESTRYGMEKYHEKFHLVGLVENEEYLADVSRFIIELSQIDPTKLSSENRIDYDILFSNLNKLHFINNNIREWEWNPLWILEEIYDGLFLLSELPNINMEIRVGGVKGRLEIIPEMLNRSMEIIVLSSKLHYELSSPLIDQIIKIIDQIPLKLNSDNLTLDAIDELIRKSKLALVDYSSWLDKIYNNKSSFQFPNELELLDQAFSLFVGEQYFPNHVYKLANKKRISSQDHIFNLALPIYLQDNDEPVWLDRDDTLEVIHWTLDFINNKPENQVSHAGILSHFYESISNLEKFVEIQRIVPENINKRIKLDFSPKYIQLSSFVQLFNYYPKKYNSEILYYIHTQNEMEGLFPLIRQEIDLINAANIIPGKTIQIAHAQKNVSKIRYMFPDLVNESGWELYSKQILLDAGFSEEQEIYKILLLREELKIICQTIIEEQYYSGEINKKASISYLRREAFLDDSNAKKLLLSSESNYFTGTQYFVGMMEINSIRNELKKKNGDKFNIKAFHQKYLQYGVIPFNQLKKELLF